MTLLKKLVLAAAVLVLATADSHAGPRRPLFRRACVSPAPARVVSPPQYDTIPRPLVPVPVIPPGVQMPTVGLLTLPSRTVGGCVGSTCGVR